MVLEKAKNEVQRKIGRNLLLFQQFELRLKWLLTKTKIEICSTELASVLELKKNKSINKMTLGELIRLYTKQIQYVSEPEVDESSSVSKGFRLKFSYWKNADADYFDSKEETFRALTSERNELVHHLCQRINLESIESWIETERYLDYQRDKIVSEITELQQTIDSVKKMIKKVSELLAHQESDFVFMLCDIASNTSRSDGWTPLDVAGKLIRQYAPEEITTLRKKYGRKTLKGLVLATEIFDIYEESTGKGSVRVFYRVKH